jgi:hypothetical protein
MDDKMTAQPDTYADSLEKPSEDDMQGSHYEFYFLLQTLKAGGISFDTFIERATAWAITRAAQQ